MFLNASRVFHHDGHSSYLAFRLFLDVFRLCSAAGSCPERHWNISGIIFIPASVYHLTVASLRLYDRYKRHVWLSLGGFHAVSNHGFSGYTFVSDARQDAWDYYLIYSWMAALFVCFFFVLMGLSLHHDWTAIRTAVLGIGKLWNRGLLAAFCTAYLGSVDYLPGHSVYRSIRSVAGISYLVIARFGATA